MTTLRFTLSDKLLDDVGWAILRETPEIIEAHQVTGDDCYIVKAALASVDHLWTLLEKLSAYGNVTTAPIDGRRLFENGSRL